MSIGAIWWILIDVVSTNGFQKKLTSAKLFHEKIDLCWHCVFKGIKLKKNNWRGISTKLLFQCDINLTKEFYVFKKKLSAKLFHEEKIVLIISENLRNYESTDLIQKNLKNQRYRKDLRLPQVYICLPKMQAITVPFLLASIID